MSVWARLTHGTILIAAPAPLALGLVAFLLGHIDMQPWVIRLRQPAAALVLDGGTAYLLTGDFEGHFKIVEILEDVRARRRSPAGHGITDEKIATYAKRQFSQTRIRHRVFGLWQEAPVSRWYTGPVAKYRRFSTLGMSVALSSIPAAMLIARRLHSVRRRRRRMASNQCVNCAYNLTGLTEPRCPECATPFDQNRSIPANPSPLLSRVAAISGLTIGLTIAVISIVSIERVIVFNTGRPELAFREYNHSPSGGVEISFAAGLLEVRHRPPIPAMWVDSIAGMEGTLTSRGGLSAHPSSGWATYDIAAPRFRPWPQEGVFQHRLLPALPGRRTALVIRLPLWILFLLFAIPTSLFWRRGWFFVKNCTRQPFEPKGGSP